jgi:hypothetical protein
MPVASAQSVVRIGMTAADIPKTVGQPDQGFEAAFLWVAHDVGPRAMSPKIKNFVQPKSWFVDFSTMTMN